MGELAEQFKTSRARAILCILDCCFSGAAPAKVLANAPVPRMSASPFDVIAGKGRVLIAAASPTEAAWEQPGTGHGLLTKAIIDVLTGWGSPEVSLLSAIDEIVNRTRAEALRIGVTQNPVFVNHVEGGLSFPKLQPGRNFHAMFPGSVGPKLTGLVGELAAHGLAAPVLDIWSDRYPDGLNELQLLAANEHGVLRGESLLVVAPTSSGKTFVGEMAALRAINQGRKALFLLPYRALTNEKYEEFRALYGPLGLRVARCTGDFSDQAQLITSGRYDIGLLTYEMFLGLALSAPSVMSQAGLIVLDEGQFITDSSRGIVVELLLTLVIRARERGISPQLIVLSAVIGNVNSFDEWLGCARLVVTTRPVPLLEGVLDRSGMFEYLDENGAPRTQQLIPASSVRVRRDKSSSQDVIVPLVRKLVGDGEKVIIFRNRKAPAEGCAKYLADELQLPSVTAALSELPVHDISSTSRKLRECLSGGTAFHDTNLGAAERSIVERYYRDPQGGIEVLASTTTLAAGINTPASTVILVEHKFPGEQPTDYTVAEYKNMVGRAGRLGFNERGKSILLADNSMERRQLFQRYVLGVPERVESSFKDRELATWVLRLYSQAKLVRRTEVPSLLANTFGGFLKAKADPQWLGRSTSQIEAVLGRMIQHGLLEDEGDDMLRLTLLGSACGRSTLSFESSLRLIDMLRQRDMGKLTGQDLVALIQVLSEADASYTPINKKGTAESLRVSQASARYDTELIASLRSYTSDSLDHWARCKRAAILKDWTDGIPVERIEGEYSTSPFAGGIDYGHIRNFADVARYTLRSAQQIVSALDGDHSSLLADIDKMVLSLEFGVPHSYFGLLSLPMSLTRGEILALAGLGALTYESIRALPADQLIRILGRERASLLQQ